jgi:hypothetical protein
MKSFEARALLAKQGRTLSMDPSFEDKEPEKTEDTKSESKATISKNISLKLNEKLAQKKKVAESTQQPASITSSNPVQSTKKSDMIRALHQQGKTCREIMNELGIKYASQVYSAIQKQK